MHEKKQKTRILKNGFHHCFVCLLGEENWLLVDGRSGIPRFKEICPSEIDVAGYYRNHGASVTETFQRDTPPRTPFIANSCVGMVKAVLCIRAPLVWTPSQLYRYLLKQ